MTESSVLTYRGLLDDATEILHESSQTPRIDAEVLMQHVVERPLAWLIAYANTIATADHARRFFELVNQRYLGQPIAYLTGRKDFWSLSLKVDNHVLIPRADTETLVEHALTYLPKGRALDVLDLGTGSGAIALSIAKERPNIKVLAVDSQTGALTIARENAKSNKIDNAYFLHSNWYSAIPDNTRFELITSNPPYIEAGDPHLDQGDLRFEPNSALVAQQDGLSELETIIETAPQFLKARGRLIVEHGYNQAEPVADLFIRNGFNGVICFNDINNLPRCTVGQFN